MIIPGSSSVTRTVCSTWTSGAQLLVAALWRSVRPVLLLPPAAMAAEAAGRNDATPRAAECTEKGVCVCVVGGCGADGLASFSISSELLQTLRVEFSVRANS